MKVEKMKHIFITMTALMGIAFGTLAQDANQGKYFPYPTVPDENMSLSERCNYLSLHFWDKCNVKSAFSDRKKMQEAFADWTGFLPYTTIDTAYLAIDKVLTRFTAPEQTLGLAQLAEAYLYSDTAQYVIEELYQPFVEAVVKAKKLSSADKARYQAQLQILRSSKVGDTIPDMAVKGRDGQPASLLKPDSNASVLLFINDPDCDDCRMARVRLSSDYNTRQLIDQGLLRVLSVYPGEYSDEWAKEAATYPAGWDVVTAPDIDQYIDLRHEPVLYYLDKDLKVLLKNVEPDYILQVFQQYITSHPIKN